MTEPMTEAMEHARTPASRVTPLALASACVAAATFAIADGDPLFALTVPALLAAYWLTGARAYTPIPRALVNTLLAGIVGFAGLRALENGLNVSLFSAFVAMLLIAKVLDRGRVRDVTQIVTLSLFLGIGSMLTNNSLPTAVGLAALAALLLAAVLRLQIAGALERTDTPAGEQPPAGQRPALRRLAVTTGAIGLVIGAAVFVVLPRELGVSAFGHWGNASVGRSVNFDDEVTLGTGGLISESPDPVLDLRVRGRDGETRGGAGIRYYLRGAVLTNYENGSWRRPDAGETEAWSNRGPSPLEMFKPHLLAGTTATLRDWTLEQEISIRRLPRSGTPIFTVWEPIQIDTARRTQVSVLGETLMILAGRQSGRFDYTILSRPPRVPQNEDLPAFEGSAAVFPDAVARLAREVLEAAEIPITPRGRVRGDASRAASAIDRHFSDGAYTYTLNTLAAPPDRDPVEWFLTDARRGHCEYYASAMAAMCRTVGLNARVVTGYVASEYNAATDHYLVRASDAHAWVEVEVAPNVWTTYDPTPPADFDRVHARDTSIAAQLRRLFDTIEFAWIRSFVAFDDESRANILGRGENDAARIDNALTGVFARLEGGGAPLIARSALVGLIVFAGVYGVGLATLHLASTWRFWLLPLLLRLRLPIAAASGASGHDLAVRRLDRAFKRAGKPRAPSTPLRMHVEGSGLLDALGPSFGQRLRTVTDRIYAWSFSRKAQDPVRLREILAESADVARALRRGRVGKAPKDR